MSRVGAVTASTHGGSGVREREGGEVRGERRVGEGGGGGEVGRWER